MPISISITMVMVVMIHSDVSKKRPDHDKSPPRKVAGYGKISAESSDGYSFPSGDSMNGMSVAMAFHHAGYRT